MKMPDRTKVIDFLLPHPLKIFVRGIVSRIIGYQVVTSWKVATQKSHGYSHPITTGSIARSKNQSTEVSPFIDERYLRVSAAILSSAMNIHRPLRVLDIGGAYGDYYFAIRQIAPALEIDWLVLETEAHCRIIPLELSRHLSLRWTSSDCVFNEKFDLVLMSSVIQYFENWNQLIQKVAQCAPTLVFSRTPLSTSDTDRIAIQRVGIRGSKGSYPVHILSKSNLVRTLSSIGKFQYWWESTDDIAVVRFEQINSFGCVFRPN